MSEEELFKYYEEVFKPIYADMVATIGEKPEQIAFELEAVLSHISVAHTHPDVYDKNVERALGHLHRATLDAAKIMWLDYRQRAEMIVLDKDLRKFAANAGEHELLEKYQIAEAKAIEARKTELQNTGRDPDLSIANYYEAATLFREVISLIDPSKVSDLRQLQSKFKRKEIIISFLIGCASSALITLLLA